ncbi:MAG: hypothetical protein QOJ59_4328, partial [Thermomicrobiales bacterium]|nr:hypothetical protein [Thermomicrobiales bacterium]
LIAAAEDNPAVFEEPPPIEDEAQSSLDLSAFDKLAERFRPFGGTPSLV